jgi:hypothetical protein
MVCRVMNARLIAKILGEARDELAELVAERVANVVVERLERLLRGDTKAGRRNPSRPGRAGRTTARRALAGRAKPTETRDQRRSPPERTAKIKAVLAALRAGTPPATIAVDHHVSIATVYRYAKRYRSVRS